ncbi:serine/threonine-protein kinase TNNI3K-like [Benincasa hispida]|uniref:serine/threonine-protein kinase TNNI3K-like n=1 Tax=Benincasa hispida TaxID=102211 RepID=UPI001900D0EB|nr:serine/threonine-protein kinase TNNI3K-like [Benincasa hispida]
MEPSETTEPFCYGAVIKEQWKKVKEELKDETKIVAAMTASRDTAVHLAVYSGEEEPLRSLLLHISGMDEVSWKNSSGNTPLHEAAIVGNLAAVKLLVEFNKEDLLALNDPWETPLFSAARCGHLHIVNYFLEDCDDFFSRSSRNWTNRKGTPIIHAPPFNVKILMWF